MDQQPTPAQSLNLAQKPDFRSLLEHPDVTDTPLPEDFDRDREAQHLDGLYERIVDFQEYTFISFIHAGGSGMQFRVQPKRGGSEQALKVARAYFFGSHSTGGDEFSPVSQAELKALELFGHTHLVRLFRVIRDGGSTVALCTTLVKGAKQIDRSLDRVAFSSFGTSARTTNPACTDVDLWSEFLIEKFLDVASALSHMHENGVYHFDVKSANILISESNEAILTDMGSCVFYDKDREEARPLSTRVTWAYAHPDIQNISKSHAGSIEGGGLKTKATIFADKTIARFDLYALAKTIQECLAEIYTLSGQQCFASYPFRFLYLVACLLLDGHNRTDEGVREDNGHFFVDDVALGYPKELFVAKKIESAQGLVRILRRFGHPDEWCTEVPELDYWVPSTINSGVGRPVPYTKRVEAVMTHPAMIRLRNEVQLGWVREVFPGAENNRWAHSLGVFGRVVSIYDAILSDPEFPTALVLIDPVDIDTALITALVHDAGQTSFGHDFEGVLEGLQHEPILKRLLDDQQWKPTLREVIATFWPRVSIERVLRILGIQKDGLSVPADGIVKDCINGPIDADKQDYLERDSIGCGVPYGKGIDHDRLLRSLTVVVTNRSMLSLAYKAKGRSAVEGLLFSRYHMYTAVYWHHAFRSMQAMFLQAATMAILEGLGNEIAGRPEFLDAYYKRVVCGLPWEQAAKGSEELASILAKGRSSELKVRKERAIDLLWIISGPESRDLLERMATRKLHKRIHEVNIGDISFTQVDATYNNIKGSLAGRRRIDKAKELELELLGRLEDRKSSLQERLKTATDQRSKTSLESRLDLLSDRLASIRKLRVPLIVLDLPTRGIPKERNVPKALGDSFRKYFKMGESGHSSHMSPGSRTFETVQNLQQAMACFRVFAAPELHDLLVQYLEPKDIDAAVNNVLPEAALP